MKVSAGTITRTIILMLALINQVLAVLGYNVIDISDDTINTMISTAITIVTAIVAWWKNNSFTQAAIEADAVMKNIKDSD